MNNLDFMNVTSDDFWEFVTIYVTEYLLTPIFFTLGIFKLHKL